MVLKLIVGLLMIAGVMGAYAAPNIPSSELPGRDRQRFLEMPVDRFTDPLAKPRNTEPLWRWECDDNARTRKAKKKRSC